jgi:hypothetical protein
MQKICIYILEIWKYVLGYSNNRSNWNITLMFMILSLTIIIGHIIKYNIRTTKRRYVR